MKKRIELVVEWESVKDFHYGVKYSEDDIVRYDSHKGIKGFKDIPSAVKHNFKVDYLRFMQPSFLKFKDNLLYRLEKYEAIMKQGKLYAKLSFVIVVFGIVTYTYVRPPEVVPNYATTEKISTKGKPVIKTKPKPKVLEAATGITKKTPVAASTGLLYIKNKVAFYETKIHFNPNAPLLYSGKYAEKLTSPFGNPVLRKFDTYNDGVLFFYFLAKQHNLTHKNKVNVRAYMAQVGIEMNLRPIKRGWVSTLGTYTNNPHGGKTFDKGETDFLWAKDDEYKQKDGKWVKKHSKFKVFKSFEEAIADYANLINAPRYRGGVEVEYVRDVMIKGKYVKKVTILKNDITPYMDSKDWYNFIRGMRISGYCTAPENQYERQCRVTYLEQSKVLKAYGINE